MLHYASFLADCHIFAEVLHGFRLRHITHYVTAFSLFAEMSIDLSCRQISPPFSHITLQLL